MTKGENYNKPRVGSKIAVDPIRRMKDIQSISKLLSDNLRIASCTVVFLIFPIHTTIQSIIIKGSNSNFTCGKNIEVGQK